MEINLSEQNKSHVEWPSLCCHRQYCLMPTQSCSRRINRQGYWIRINWDVSNGRKQVYTRSNSSILQIQRRLFLAQDVNNQIWVSLIYSLAIFFQTYIQCSLCRTPKDLFLVTSLCIGLCHTSISPLTTIVNLNSFKVHRFGTWTRCHRRRGMESYCSS